MLVSLIVDLKHWNYFDFQEQKEKIKLIRFPRKFKPNKQTNKQKKRLLNRVTLELANQVTPLPL